MSYFVPILYRRAGRGGIFGFLVIVFSVTYRIARPMERTIPSLATTTITHLCVSRSRGLLLVWQLDPIGDIEPETALFRDARPFSDTGRWNRFESPSGHRSLNLACGIEPIASFMLFRQRIATN
jgi:hypothetical protein